MNPLIGLGLLQTGTGFLSGLLGGDPAQEAYNRAQANKKLARENLSGYGYTGYSSNYDDLYNNYIKSMGKGGLTAAQEQQLGQAGREGQSNIATAMANRGGTIGGQLAMTQKMNNDLSNQRLNMADTNISNALSLAQARDQFNLSDWLNQQNAKMRYKELMAQYS